jgi:aminopeptidase 2
LNSSEVNNSSRIYPDWKVDANFITEHLNAALRLDAKLSSHPIEVDCPDASAINQVSRHAMPCRAFPLSRTIN